MMLMPKEVTDGMLVITNTVMKYSGIALGGGAKPKRTRISAVHKKPSGMATDSVQMAAMAATAGPTGLSSVAEDVEAAEAAAARQGDAWAFGVLLCTLALHQHGQPGLGHCRPVRRHEMWQAGARECCADPARQVLHNRSRVRALTCMAACACN